MSTRTPGQCQIHYYKQKQRLNVTDAEYEQNIDYYGPNILAPTMNRKHVEAHTAKQDRAAKTPPQVYQPVYLMSFSQPTVLEEKAPAHPVLPEQETPPDSTPIREASQFTIPSDSDDTFERVSRGTLQALGFFDDSQEQYPGANTSQNNEGTVFEA